MIGAPPPDRPPTAPTALWRGLTRRCPWCGRGRLFTRWFRMAEACPRCGLPLDQEEGAFLGAMALNYGVAGVLFLTILIAWTAATAPDFPVGPILVVGLGVTAASILLFYPFSKTLWAAVDLLLHGWTAATASVSRTTSVAHRPNSREAQSTQPGRTKPDS